MPKEAIKSKITGENLVDVVEDDLAYFSNLVYLDVSDNKIRLDQLWNLLNLNELHMQYN